MRAALPRASPSLSLRDPNAFGGVFRASRRPRTTTHCRAKVRSRQSARICCSTARTPRRPSVARGESEPGEDEAAAESPPQPAITPSRNLAQPFRRGADCTFSRCPPNAVRRPGCGSFFMWAVLPPASLAPSLRGPGGLGGTFCAARLRCTPARSFCKTPACGQLVCSDCKGFQATSVGRRVRAPRGRSRRREPVEVQAGRRMRSGLFGTTLRSRELNPFQAFPFPARVNNGLP